jgi:hypothetical protein
MRDLVAEALGAREQGAGYHGVGDTLPSCTRLGEVGMGGDPVVDGAARHAEEAGQLLVGGAEQAVVVTRRPSFERRMAVAVRSCRR